MDKVMNDQVQAMLEQQGVVAVLEITAVEQAVPTARALIAGGIKIIELALRTEAAESAIKAIRKEVPEMIVGAGTLISQGQAKKVKSLGASFGVSPGFNRSIVEEALKCSLPFAPGIATPSDIEAAIAVNCGVLKFFPAAPLGGLNYLKSMAAPYNHLGLKYFPLGGITEENLAEYAAMPQVIAIGGSWIAKRELIEKQDWAEIEKKAKNALAIWKKAKAK